MTTPMKHVARRMCLLIAVSLMTSLIAQAGVILSENFNELTPQLTAFSAGPFHTMNGTNIDIVGGSLFGNLCISPESGHCIDMGGSFGNNAVGVFQSNHAFTLVPGGSYYLSFDLIGSHRLGLTTSTTVNFGPYSNTFVLTSGDVTSGIVVNQLVTVSTTETTYLTFTNNSPNDNIGSVLDNVSIASGSPIPEPGTLLMLGPGVLGIGGLLRRKMMR